MNQIANISANRISKRPFKKDSDRHQRRQSFNLFYRLQILTHLWQTQNNFLYNWDNEDIKKWIILKREKNFDFCSQFDISIITYFKAPSSRTRTFSTFSRVISDNAKKVLQFTNVNISSDFSRGSVEYCLLMQNFQTNPNILGHILIRGR